MNVKYLLTVLTNGRDEYLERTLAAFREHVTPEPSAVYIYDDGNTTKIRPPQIEAWGPQVESVIIEGRPERLGQCAAQAECWHAAASCEYDWAFHLEDDMVVLREIELAHFTSVMNAEDLAQMALMRTPWGAEIPYGGYLPAAPSFYAKHRWRWHEWIEHRRNWTNAPCLFRTDTARRVPWPTYPGCETEVGPAILELHRAFGIWGAGECNVAHIGVDRAPGAHGY